MSRRITAAELMAKLNTDPEFVIQSARQDAEHKKRATEFDRAEAPLVEELRAAGCLVKSVWNLIPEYSRTQGRRAPYPKALPILLEHLSKPYPSTVLEGIARALGVPEAKFAWPVLLRRYQSEQSIRIKDGLAVAIAAVADEELISDVILLAHNRQHGPSRLLLLTALERSKDPRAHKALLDLAADQDMKKEVLAILGRQERSDKDEVARTRLLPVGNLTEASTNLDLEDVPRFLTQLTSLVEGLETSEIKRIEDRLLNMQTDEEQGFDLQVLHGGKAVPLRIRLYMSDVDAPDIAFFTSSELASAIDKLIAARGVGA